MVITADHGFLLQQEAIGANDKATFPLAELLSYRHRRFALGEGIEPVAGQPESDDHPLNRLSPGLS